MSSLRNSIQRRPHRERAQPLERRRLGLLEKHKDYSQRAKDYNQKKATLKALREKAADRNEDEFYFGMMSRKGPGAKITSGKSWNGRVEGDRGNNKGMDMDTVRLLKTQDLGYVRTMKQVAVKELARLEEQAVLVKGLEDLAAEEAADDDDEDLDDSEEEESSSRRRRRSGAKGPRKIVFMDNEDEREEALQAAAESQGPTREDQQAAFERSENLVELKRKLQHARKKVKSLTMAESQLEVQQAKMAKTATSGGTTRRGKKIMVRKRKR
ncbi:U3 small nucleolar RNA-associated protein 11 [Trichoderma citrinoviride]|uniref:U3 small nucleolar RNA-associated protein 11 n=1 Tax=Trichoderma citrinoviride TaxID=58853 RepID=A0A2T4BHH0_9HYPO|nr:U3 small nucleolar RNA-associated protein 11 [Trichoderma citrinoviride]PTB68718.1 U3 small nucleolar RNA-associated protein 11 [Trichoderma citrinoviride]